MEMTNWFALGLCAGVGITLIPLSFELRRINREINRLKMIGYLKGMKQSGEDATQAQTHPAIPNPYADPYRGIQGTTTFPTTPNVGWSNTFPSAGWSNPSPYSPASSQFGYVGYGTAQVANLPNQAINPQNQVKKI